MFVFFATHKPEYMSLEINEPQVSVFKKITQSSNGDVFALNEIYKAIKNGHWKERVEQYRALPNTTKDEEEKKKSVKNSLPYFTGSGVFKGRRKAESITEYNGRIVVDIDHIVNMNEARELLNQDEFTEASFKSVSGDGLAIVVKIEPERFAETFVALESYYKNKYSHVIKVLDKAGNPREFSIDKSCSDCSRPRFISFDPELFINSNSSLFVVGRDYVGHVKRVTRKMIEEAVKGEVHNTLIKASRLMGGYIAGKLIEEDEGEEWLVECMSAKDGVVSLEVERKKIRDGVNNGKGQPITAQMLVKSEKENDVEKKFYSELYAYIHSVNRAGREWTKEDVEMIYSQYGDKITFTDGQIERMFRKVFEDNQDEFGIDDKPDIYKVEVFLRKNYVFARNEVTQTVEYRQSKEAEFKEVDSDSIYRHLQHVGFKFPFDKLRSLLKSDFVPLHNPFADYFQNLTPWDGKTDHIAKLANYIKVDDQQFYVEQFRKMLVRCIGCALYGVENRIVFVFVGEKQNTGKSTFIRFLNPFGKHYYTEAPIRNDKDSSFAFSENFIYNMEELSSLNNIEINRLKAIISTASIKERKAYAVQAKEQPRRCNFWGSTNKPEFLIDTENTRWLCFNVSDVSWDYKKEVEIHDVWSQAFALWHSDFNPQLTKDEALRRDLRNKDFEISELEKEIIKRLFTVCDPYEGQFVTNADILQSMNSHWEGKNQLNSRFISKIMVQLGFKNDVRKLNGHTVRGFYVQKTPNETNFSSFFDRSDDQKPEKVTTDVTENSGRNQKLHQNPRPKLF